MVFEDGQFVNNIAFDIPRKAFYNVHLEIAKYQKSEMLEEQFIRKRFSILNLSFKMNC